MKYFFASRIGIIGAGAIIGTIAALLQYAGNPANMGICVACFLRDIAGALGLHRAGVVQYLRPEIIGMFGGAFIAALLFKDFRPSGGSSPIVRFFLGMLAMFGALVFLGCPWRAVLRLAGGDANALFGIIGLVAGISIGIFFLTRGYSLGKKQPLSKKAGWLLPVFWGVLLLLLIFQVKPLETGALFFSASGPGSLHPAVWLSLLAGLAIGIIAQRSRFCSVGAIRDAVLVKDFHLFSGLLAFLGAALVWNLLLGQFRLGFEGQPIAHTDSLWNALGMVLAGMAFVLAGGCPGRQVFLSGEGDMDAAVFVMGMLVGAGLAHNFGVAASPGGVTLAGQVTVILGIIICLILGFTNLRGGETR
ncbi:MAG: YedE-related selenium metabolism membrane protein [Deltaproteobacteria bacterium]|nr:YedE-related selenium metabolism membrane protein [Deltaproteobacteria bacterium]